MPGPSDSSSPDHEPISTQLRKEKIRASLFRKPPAPVKVGRFTLLERIGAGSMGEVYAAYDEQLDRKVGIKLIRGGPGSGLSSGGSGQTPDSDQTSQRAGRRLLREAKTLAQLSHPNVVQIFDAGQYEDRVFIAMELVRGTTMDHWLRSVETGPRSQRYRDILQCFIAAGRGIEAAHAAGVTHCDIKPGNILVGDDGRVRVADFGLARTAASPTHESTATATPTGTGAPTPPTDGTLTVEGGIRGTPAYMAPELFDGEPADPCSDQFSFCVTLYEALCGERPYSRTSAELARDAAELFTADPGKELPAAIRKALARGLARDPTMRFATMTDLLSALETWPQGKRRRWIAAAAAAAILVAGGLYSQRDASPVCQGADREIAEVWSPQRERALEELVHRAGGDHGRELWPLIASAADDHARSWAEVHTDACLAHREGRQSAVLLDKRMACLERARSQFASVLDIVEEVDASTLGGAAEAMQDLPAVSRCSRVDVLLAAIPPPEDPEIAARVRALRSELDRASALESAGRYQDARALVDDLIDRAEPLAYDPLLAEALIIAGKSDMHRGLRIEAIAPLGRAVELALRARMYPTAIEAFARLLYVQGTQPDPGSDLLSSSPFFEALGNPLPDSGFARALLFNNTGAVHFARDRREQALDYFQRAVALQEQDPDIATIELLFATQNLVMLTPDPDARLRLIRQVTARFEQTLGPSHARTLDQRVHSASFIDDPRQAHDVLAPACERLQRAHVENLDTLTRCLYRLGLLAADLGDHRGAVRHFAALLERTHDAARDASRHSARLRDTRTMAAGYLAFYGDDPATAASSFRSAVSTHDREKLAWWQKAPLADALLGLGLTRAALGDDRAIDSLQRARQIYHELLEYTYNAQYRRRLAQARVALARALWRPRSDGDAPSSATAVRELLDAAESWYRAAGPGYRDRLRELAEWRRRHGIDPVTP